MLARAAISAIGSFVFPGFGQAASLRDRWAIAWAAAVPIATLLVFVSMWFFIAAFALRLLSMLHAFWTTARAKEVVWFRPLVFAVGAVSVLTVLAIRGVVIEGFKTPSSSMYPTLLIGDHIFVDRLSQHWRAFQRGDVVVFDYPCDTSRQYIKRIIGLGGDTIEVRCNVVYVNGKAVENTLVDGTCTYDDRDDRTGIWSPRPCSRYHETLDGHHYDVFHDSDRPARDKAGATQGDHRDFPRRGEPNPSCSNADFEDNPTRAKQSIGKIVEAKPEATATACEPQLHYVVPEGTTFAMGDNRNNSNDSRIWGVASLSAIRGRVIGIWLADGEHGLDWSRIGPLR